MNRAKFGEASMSKSSIAEMSWICFFDSCDT